MTEIQSLTDLLCSLSSPDSTFAHAAPSLEVGLVTGGLTLMAVARGIAAAGRKRRVVLYGLTGIACVALAGGLEYERQLHQSSYGKWQCAMHEYNKHNVDLGPVAEQFPSKSF